jgi:hypothetical protein
MKKIFLYSSCLVLLAGSLTFTACNSNKSGCPSENAAAKPNRKGEYGTRHGGSNLFPKQARKKMKVRG